jgi:hypothetical protein
MSSDIEGGHDLLVAPHQARYVVDEATAPEPARHGAAVFLAAPKTFLSRNLIEA